MKNENLVKSIDKLTEPRILIVGDFALDEMVYGSTERISREAPVLILEHYETKKILGAAANAAHNISTLNLGKAAALGVYGDDYQGSELLRVLEENKIDTSLMVLDKTRNTTTKTRISGSCSHSITQQIVRIDRQTKTPLSAETEKKVIKNIKASIKDFDGIILSDYHLGFLTPAIVRTVVEEANKYNKIVVADIQKDMKKYKGVTAITPNQPDCEQAVGLLIRDKKTLEAAGNKLLKLVGSKMVLLTRGENGMSLFENGSCSSIPAYNKKEVFDVTGAGDTVVAAFTLALCAGYEPLVAMYLGNLAASIAIRFFGCHAVTLNELKNELKIEK